MGKRIKGKEEARQNRTFRLSDYELSKLSENAKAAGMNESEYVRSLIVRGSVDAAHAEDRRNLIRQISGIATNVNQMAKRCNENEWIGSGDVYRLKMLLEDILGLEKQLFERWR